MVPPRTTLYAAPIPGIPTPEVLTPVPAVSTQDVQISGVPLPLSSGSSLTISS